MNRTLIVLLVSAAAAAAVLWQRPSPFLRAQTADHVHSGSCDCGHESENAVATTKQPLKENPKPDIKPSEVANWTSQLQARLAAGEAPADLHSLLVDLVGRDGERAMEAALSAGRDPHERRALAMLTVEIWGAIDPTPAWRWAQRNSTSSNPSDRGSLFTAVLNGIASTQPDSVIPFVDTFLAETERKAAPETGAEITQAAITALVKSGQYQTAAAALSRWDSALDSEKLGELPFATLAAAWSEHSPAETAEWLNTLPGSERRRSGLAALAERSTESAEKAAQPAKVENAGQ
jgi:hypothetical protein